MVIRVYSAHLTIAGEASLRSSTHLEPLPKTLTLAARHQDQGLLAGRGVCESGAFGCVPGRGSLCSRIISPQKFSRMFSRPRVNGRCPDRVRTWSCGLATASWVLVCCRRRKAPIERRLARTVLAKPDSSRGMHHATSRSDAWPVARHDEPARRRPVDECIDRRSLRSAAWCLCRRFGPHHREPARVNHRSPVSRPAARSDGAILLRASSEAAAQRGDRAMGKSSPFRCPRKSSP